jgi:hypothetical protein
MEESATAIRRSRDGTPAEIVSRFPHQEIVDAIIFMPKQVPNCGDLSPGSVREIRLPVRWKMTCCFRDYFHAALYRAAGFEIGRITFEGEAIRDLRHGIY